jgi:ATP-dependent DNA ligase
VIKPVLGYLVRWRARSSTFILSRRRIEHGLEGVVAKRKDGLYKPGKRTGSWAKMRINRGQEFVVGGYIPGPHGVDSIIVGYYRGKDLFVLRRSCAKWVCASNAEDGLRKIATVGYRQMPVHQFAGNRTRQMGRDFRR